MTLTQKIVLRELLAQSIAHGFEGMYPLAPIAEKLKIEEPLYNNNTNTGLLWEFGPHGNGMIYARGDWPNACASIDYHYGAAMIENWTHPSQEPIG